jgi:hypothetical protein
VTDPLTPKPIKRTACPIQMVFNSCSPAAKSYTGSSVGGASVVCLAQLAAGFSR